MNKKPFLLDRKKWLKEGFILQNSRQNYILGQGPFIYRSKPSPQSLYHPDFFLTLKKPWVKASVTGNLNKKDLEDFLFDSKMDSFQRGLTDHSSSLKGRGESPFKPTFKNQSLSIKKKFKNTFHLDHVCRDSTNCKPPSFIKYQELFCQIQQLIQQGIFQKLVPALSESFTLDRNPLLCLQKLFKNTYKFSHGFLYGFWEGDKGLLGFTPEVLFSLKGNAFSTMALAGTKPYPGPSLLKDFKEQREQALVVQNLQESLKGFLDLKPQKTVELVFPPVKHLYTKLEGDLAKTFDFEKFCHKLHPTSALGGYPQKLAFEWLKQHPLQKDRGRFGAPFGYFHSSKEAFCLVVLRALEWEGDQVQIFSGGGLLKESLLQKEWRELFLKRQQVKTFFCS